jgi:probable rRNA maturation factor
MAMSAGGGARNARMAERSEIDVRVDHEAWGAAIGGDPEAFVIAILAAAAGAEGRPCAVAVLLTAETDMRALNALWRGKDAPTNILSFPAPEGAGYLGDIAIAYETVDAEARAQGKTFPAHLAHLLTHGFLHLLGYDHEADDQAERMEARERAILAGLGYRDPYLVDEARS